MTMAFCLGIITGMLLLIVVSCADSMGKSDKN